MESQMVGSRIRDRGRAAAYHARRVKTRPTGLGYAPNWKNKGLTAKSIPKQLKPRKVGGRSFSEPGISSQGGPGGTWKLQSTPLLRRVVPENGVAQRVEEPIGPLGLSNDVGEEMATSFQTPVFRCTKQAPQTLYRIHRAGHPGPAQYFTSADLIGMRIYQHYNWESFRNELGLLREWYHGDAPGHISSYQPGAVPGPYYRGRIAPQGIRGRGDAIGGRTQYVWPQPQNFQATRTIDIRYGNDQ